MTAILQTRHPMVMGILNVTPDSFSDGGCHIHVEDALVQAQRMLAEGAEIIDIGGESTRPGSVPVSSDEQLRRILPVVMAVRQRGSSQQCLVSVDTTRGDVARAAMDAGADLINDVSAGRDDPEMFYLVAERGVPIVLMHMQGTPQTMQDNPYYDDVLTEVENFLQQRIEAALTAGVKSEQIILDPGIGFGKRREDNLALLGGLKRLVGMGYPVLLGSSRKRFMGTICRETDPCELLGATVATTAWGVTQGVRIFRVHDVKANRQALDVMCAINSNSLEKQ